MDGLPFLPGNQFRDPTVRKKNAVIFSILNFQKLISIETKLSH